MFKRFLRKFIGKKKEGDAVMEGGRKTDIVILVMGPTGAGKSTFIQNILKSLGHKTELPATGDGFDSCTQRLGAYIAILPKDFPKVSGRRLVLVDTPGFEDTTIDDSEILRQAGVWLVSSFGSRMKIRGVIYLYPIYPNRATNSNKTSLKALQELCGMEDLSQVRMVTTRWSLCPELGVGEAREGELKSKFWKDMVERGSKMSRLDNTQESAMKLLREVLL